MTAWQRWGFRQPSYFESDRQTYYYPLQYGSEEGYSQGQRLGFEGQYHQPHHETWRYQPEPSGRDRPVQFRRAEDYDTEYDYRRSWWSYRQPPAEGTWSTHSSTEFGRSRWQGRSDQQQYASYYSDPFRSYSPYRYEYGPYATRSVLTPQWAPENQAAPLQSAPYAGEQTTLPLRNTNWSQNRTSVFARKDKDHSRINKAGRYNPAYRSLFHSTAPNDDPSRRSGPGRAKTEQPLRRSARLQDRPRKDMIPRPSPSRSYEAQANQEPKTVSQARRLLIILDLNGTLLYRHKGRNNSGNFLRRPHLDEFLTYIFTHHRVMVWSSARPHNVTMMCDQLFTPEQRAQLVDIWARDRLRLSPAAYNERAQVYKQLTWVWQHLASRHGKLAETWDQTNTLLLDDSRDKAASEPYNIIEVDEFEGTPEQAQADLLGQVVVYLEELKMQSDVSAFMRTTPFVYGPEWKVKWGDVKDGKQDAAFFVQ